MIPVCVPYLSGNEVKYVTDAIETGWISSVGKYVEKLEEEFAKWCGVKHALSATSGTTALHLALLSLGIGPGDEVIVPNFTMFASASSVCHAGAVPVFVDAERETWNIDTEKIEEKITPKTKAIMAVHIYGHPCNMGRILEIAQKHNLMVIEDAAESHGAEINGKKCGTFGDVAAFSFYGNKILTSGEGGMIITNDDEVANKVKYYRNHARPLDGSSQFTHGDIGFNYRLNNLSAAVGLAQVEKADELVGLRIKNNNLYRKYLEGVKGIYFQPEKEGYKNVYWMNAVLIDQQEFGMTRDKLAEELKKKGIGTGMFFIGMNKQPGLQKYGCDCSGDYPVSDFLAENGLYLPSGSGLSEEEIREVCDAITALHKNL